MVRAGRSAIAVAVTLAGCSLITPLDFVGGAAGTSGEGGTGGVGGSVGGRGGRGGGAGTSAEGGTGDGAMGGGGTGVGGSRGGTTGVGGAGGEGADAGEAGAAGQGGEGEGGTTTAGIGGTGGRGGRGGGGSGGAGTGGDTAGTAGGGGCPGADLESDPMHCGKCDIVCGATESCIDGLCVDSPCGGLCETWVTVPLAGDGYRMDDIGTAARCFEVVDYERTMTAPALVCWNFGSGRTLEINGVAAACMTEPGVALPPERLGGYCVKVGAGDYNYAGFKFPLP